MIGHSEYSSNYMNDAQFEMVKSIPQNSNNAQWGNLESFWGQVGF